MSQTTFDQEEPIFDVFVYTYSHLLQGQYVNMITNEFPDATLSLSSIDQQSCIKIQFKGFLTYEKAKEIMYWFCDAFGPEETDGWGCNWDIDERLVDVKKDWKKERKNN